MVKVHVQAVRQYAMLASQEECAPLSLLPPPFHKSAPDSFFLFEPSRSPLVRTPASPTASTSAFPSHPLPHPLSVPPTHMHGLCTAPCLHKQLLSRRIAIAHVSLCTPMAFHKQACSMDWTNPSCARSRRALQAFLPLIGCRGPTGLQQPAGLRQLPTLAEQRQQVQAEAVHF